MPVVGVHTQHTGISQESDVSLSLNWVPRSKILNSEASAGYVRVRARLALDVWVKVSVRSIVLFALPRDLGLG